MACGTIRFRDQETNIVSKKLTRLVEFGDIFNISMAQKDLLVCELTTKD